MGGGGDDVLLYDLDGSIDTFSGGTGNADRLQITGGTGADQLDVIFNGSVLTRSEGGSVSSIEIVVADLLGGNDVLSYVGTSRALSVNLATGTASGFASISGIENVIGGTGADFLTGDDQANGITASSGNDTIAGGLGNDTMDGGSGNDRFVFAPDFGNDVIAAGFDFNPGGGGQDLLNISAFGIGALQFSARVGITIVGTDTLVQIDGNAQQTILLTGVSTLGSITLADFIL